MNQADDRRGSASTRAMMASPTSSNLGGRGLFITGTDTGAGKTEATLALMAHLAARGQRVLGMKPVASGCEPVMESMRDQGAGAAQTPAPSGPVLCNADALRIQDQGDRRMPYDWINPYAFEPAIAPHLAAEAAGIQIQIEPILTAYQRLAAEADWVLVEGVGGWLVPFGAQSSLADLAERLGLPVVLVVGLKLGCLNQALLTEEAMRARGMAPCGWIGCQVESGMAALDGNIRTLRQRMQSPCLGILPWMTDPTPEVLAESLELTRFL